MSYTTDMINIDSQDHAKLASNTRKLRELAELLQHSGISIFEYFPAEDLLLVYDGNLRIKRKLTGYLGKFEEHTEISEEGWPLITELMRGKRTEPVEVQMRDANGRLSYCIFALPQTNPAGDPGHSLVGTITDVTLERERENILKEKAQRDSLTMLYNHSYGKEKIEQYLRHKTPYSSCGLLVMDIDYFKTVNDVYGHLFGDIVLTELASLLARSFNRTDVIMRAGGDEFVILMEDASHTALVKKTSELIKSVRSLRFRENDSAITCSIGVCFLPENLTGYTYDQLFANADWALYRAKEHGRNRFEFCDNLNRYEESETHENTLHSLESGSLYLQNDIISAVLEIFEKRNSFDTALRQVLELIGEHFSLDRITVVRTDTGNRTAGRQFQWLGKNIPEALPVESQFEKKDFLTLFNSYDSDGTVVLQYDDMATYSKGATDLLMQGRAKTVVYAALYCEGKYTGAISYVVCKEKRDWIPIQRHQLGVLTKIISSHLAKHLAIEASGVTAPSFDSLTGLVSFTRFRDDLEHLIQAGQTKDLVIVYTDFINFKYLNKKYGYRMGDFLLKDFASCIYGTMKNERDACFSRIVSDQFIFFMHYPDTDRKQAQQAVQKINDDFINAHASFFPDVNLNLRSGIYFVEPDCSSASATIDAANSARRQISSMSGVSACLYDRQLNLEQTQETEIINNMSVALKRGEFQVFMQPKFALSDYSIIGAEALVRWIKPDGTIMPPDSFIPIYERTGKISELDFYVFEQVAAFLAKNNELGRKQVPISINASILHASDSNTVKHYLDILKKYNVDPSLTEIELTETATVSDYTNVVQLFQQLQSVNMLTSLDDFGAGYSVLNTITEIPVNTVKLDRAFITRCEASEKGIYFLKQIISMVKGLGYRVICEGVETEDQISILKEAGCEEAQGYWFSRPLPMDEYEKLMYGTSDMSDTHSASKSCN
ncbi:MAG: EAL domain-containing protein [Lachnospiraceae bacterium]|nr:EAL domain-containing protein [Lachnospiraceae bacterium]